MAVAMTAEYNISGEGPTRTLALGNAMIFSMADGYVNEDKVGVPYVYACFGSKEEQNKSCVEARFEREAKKVEY